MHYSGHCSKSLLRPLLWYCYGYHYGHKHKAIRTSCCRKNHQFLDYKSPKTRAFGESFSLLFDSLFRDDLEDFYCISSPGEGKKSEKLDEGSWRDLDSDIGESLKNFIHPRKSLALRKFFYSLYVFISFELDYCFPIIENKFSWRLDIDEL